ncbi:MAG: hypothetical protein HYX76_13040 [Acidobacteria bacterium]|nr:hypothetical protein [Acidobacteriota bacterium]
MRHVRITTVIAIAIACVEAAGCDRRLVRQYEYEEEMYLGVDGSATLIVNSSLAALAALRGLPVQTDSRGRLDRSEIHRMYESTVARVMRVSRPWRRDGRRFVQIRLDVPDVRQLGTARPFDWSTYRFARDRDLLVYHQEVGRSAGAKVTGVAWRGDEVVSFRLHLPSKIFEHNTPSRRVERGNILVWEQLLNDRLAGVPVRMDVRMEQQSILYRTLWVFGLAFAAAVAMLAALIWWTMKRGVDRA